MGVAEPGGYRQNCCLGVRRGNYHLTMKKTTPKLVLRRDTLRALAGIDLTRAAGGGDAALPRESGKVQCPTFVNPQGGG